MKIKMSKKIENMKLLVIRIIKQALKKLKQENQDLISQKNIENELKALEAHI